MEKIKVGNKEVALDKDLLRFDEQTLNEFLKKFAAIYAEYHQYFTDLQYITSSYEDKLESVYSEKFCFYKNNDGKCSDKLAEARVKSDKDYQTIAENLRIAKRNLNSVNGFLRSLDRAHDDARETSYNLRKEMDKLYR